MPCPALPCHVMPCHARPRHGRTHEQTLGWHTGPDQSKAVVRIALRRSSARHPESGMLVEATDIERPAH
ncbi:unnamed protein product [Protopolystoma xenopodis]|uniref:Uncharacterized protein n=1 Tax=Protopolystoma xenopodis TaxID=117903 RepID=A0A448WI33_9PLAT|nr:unnamed protein product [Protopolystoma xenopodis]